MKKVLITMAVLTGIVACAMAFSSFATPRQESKEGYSPVDVNVPKYTLLYEGEAVAGGQRDADPKRIKVKIYIFEYMPAPKADVWLNNYDNTYTWVGWGYEVVEYHRDDGSTYYGVYYIGNEYYAYPPR